MKLIITWLFYALSLCGGLIRRKTSDMEPTFLQGPNIPSPMRSLLGGFNVYFLIMNVCYHANISLQYCLHHHCGPTCRPEDCKLQVNVAVRDNTIIDTNLQHPDNIYSLHYKGICDTSTSFPFSLLSENSWLISTLITFHVLIGNCRVLVCCYYISALPRPMVGAQEMPYWIFAIPNNLERECPSKSRGVDKSNFFCFMVQSSCKEYGLHLPALALVLSQST